MYDLSSKVLGKAGPDGRKGGQIVEIDLNADVGEGFGAYALGNDEALLGLVSSGEYRLRLPRRGSPGHGCDRVSLAPRGGAALGAHPGYPDLQGFGRRSLSLTEGEVYAITLFQVGALRAFARASGSRTPACQTPRGPVQRRGQGSRPGPRHSPGREGGGRRTAAGGPAGQRSGGGRRRSGRPLCPGILRGPGLPGRRGPWSPDPARLR
ncbi:MAG: LamB/YcsF family protein [Desulfomicrobium escambiense]|nr:LamB/YcsF family protein [Desulfomicrobium escambiense]